MQDSLLLQKNDIPYFSVPLALILPLLIKTAILINNILMEKKTYYTYFSNFLCMAFENDSQG